jgi:thiamine phosphate synthase YjbQ (UPF0047 family)
MLYNFKIETGKEGFYNITPTVRDAVKKNGVSNGLCVCLYGNLYDYK